MKTKITIIASVVLVASTIMVQALWSQWDIKKKPPISLSEALTIATSETKKLKNEYYCIRAMLGQRISNADWEFTFAATDGSFLWINVASDKSTEVSKDGFYH